ncbi:ATPase [Pseudoalteromonas distincta]
MTYKYIKTIAFISSTILSSFSHASSSVNNQAISKPDSSFNFGGVLQWDYELNKVKNNEDTSNSALRRSRLYSYGHVGNWDYKATIKLGENSKTNGDAIEAYIRYTGMGDFFNVAIGKQKEPFGLELLTSSKDISIIERSAMTEYYTYEPSFGIQITGKGSDWSYGFGIFESNRKIKSGFSNKAITGRLTKAMKVNDELLVHLGTGFTYRSAYLNNKDITNYNIEYALLYKSIHLQAEYFHTSAPHTTYSNKGHYIQLGYIFNGSRPYKAGKFKGVIPHSTRGAWEMVIRYEDGLGKFSDINLGKTVGKQISTGANYYFNKQIRFSLSYMTGEDEVSSSNNEEYRVRMQLLF